MEEILHLVELVKCLSSSNLPVHRRLRLLTTMLSACKLSMSQETMEIFLMISRNSNAWSEQEKEEILKSAIKHYLGKRRTKQ